MLCPDCGSVVSPRFPMHRCVPNEVEITVKPQHELKMLRNEIDYREGGGTRPYFYARYKDKSLEELKKERYAIDAQLGQEA